MSDSVQENPYSAILSVIRADAMEREVAPWRLGTVASADPLSVQVGELVLTGKELLVNPQLLEHDRQIVGLTGALQATGDGEECDFTALAVSSGGLSGQVSGILAPKDQVVLLQSGDGQTYIVLCKVVSG